ncbi:L,D-transpeptidase [Glycomyces xiaoerkulensis]|uniref:L,D-transpeptidase n=1 Tax=Glycomyces xiaoerkulensis TaxID=2038139 RepID=UPI000C25FB00|nr:Ig-like domain-containing protein [Glycomyces xiaoerkulensis]
MKFLPARVLAATIVLLFAGACGAPQQGAFTPAPIVPEIGLEAGDPQDPTESFTLTAVDGILEEVSVTSDRAKTIEGAFSEDLTEWTSETVMDAGSTYTVTAMAVSSDGTVTSIEEEFVTESRDDSGFAVLDVTPAIEGETVGVGAPIIVTFTEAAPDRARVEQQLRVESEKDHEGAWRWISDSQVIYRTKEYWEPHQTVTFTAAFDGALLGDGAWGGEDHSVDIEVGASQITYADVSSHSMTVEIDGEVAKEIPISYGSGSEWEYHTATGVHLVMSKVEHKVMVAPGKDEDDPDYYETPVNWATRINASGEFIHGAPWSEWAQGNTNVSHGCLNASDENAKWFYEIAQRGDPVEVVGSPREMPWTNGWGYWILSWEEWQQGSALE